MNDESDDCILLNGLFITFEGGEGAGKSSLSKKIQDTLVKQGYPVVLTREPGGTELGEAVRSTLLDSDLEGKIDPRSELFLFLAARAQHVEELIRPALNERKIVLCDRFSDSSIVYQGFARGLGEEYVTELCELSCYGIQPELTFLIDVPPEIGLERAKQFSENKKDRMENEHLEFHKKVREGFLRRAAQESQRFYTIDGTLPLDYTYELAYDKLYSILAPNNEESL
jgi:dTMP kinase